MAFTMNEVNAPRETSLRYDSSDAENDDRGGQRHTIRTYVSDMLALERHIGQPLQRQLDMDESAKYGQALSIISRIKALSETHVSMLEDHLKSFGGDAASPVKSALSSLLGAGATAVDSVRTSKVSKNLRDDHVTLCLATISYTMLHTAALGLADAATAQLAQRHLEDYAPLVMRISKAMPEVVLQELADDGEDVQITAAQIAERDTERAWK